MLENREGQNVPSVTFKTRQNHQWVDVTTDELFNGKTVIAFSLPGAFTPTCSSSHVPRYNELYDLFRQNGVDSIVCFSVNDAFVMEEWQKDQNAPNILFIPDGNGEFSDKMGMLVDKTEIGFGKRSWRYSMLVKNGVIEKMFIEPDEPGDPFKVSDADTMLEYLNPACQKPEFAAIISKDGCPFCAKAKRLLDEHGYCYEEIKLDRKTISSRTVRAMTGKSSVPQVYIDGKYIGGSDDLVEYLKNA
jgi:glutaredoxin-like protein